MKYKRYTLTFSGDPAIIAFLEQHLPRDYANLCDAKDRGRAAELLFGVSWEWQSVTTAR